MRKNKYLYLYLLLLTVILILVIVISLLFNYDNYKPQDNYTKNYTFRIIVLNTPNYDHIGCYGVNSLKKYAETHGYEFTQYREKLLPDLNVNFTKNAITIDALNNYDEDFIILSDADVKVKRLNTTLLDLFNPEDPHIFWAPRDFWVRGIRWSKINAGFIIWRNCKRSVEINELWIYNARNKCKKAAKKNPKQQNVFDRCVQKLLKKNELGYLDHKMVGLPYSKVISQSRKKKTKKAWTKLGSPDYGICDLNK